MKKLLFTFFILMAPTLASAATIGKVNANNIGLVGYWTFDGADMSPRVMDKSGNGNNGVLVNIAATSTNVQQGRIGQSFHFFGNNDHINAGTASSLQLTTKASYSFWIRIPAHGGLNRIMGVVTTNGLVPHQNDLALCMVVFGGQSSCGSSSILEVNNWVYVTMTFDSATDLAKFYKNGKLVETVVKTDEGVSTGIAFTISQSGGNNFIGDLDDLRVYNRVLTDNEIAALYNSGSAGVARSLTTATSSVALSNGLVGYWTLDGSKTNWATGKTLDSTGNGNVGQLVGMATSTAPGFGKIGQAFTFDGVDDQVVIPDSNSLDAVTGLTTSAWIKTRQTSFPDTFAYVIKKNTFTGGGPFSLYTSVGSNINFFIRTQNGGNPGLAASFGNDGAWHHVVGTYDGQAMRLYIDGVSRGAANYVDTIVVDAGNVALGGFTGTGRFFDGQIDDARVYNRALSPTEIAELYKLGDNKIAQSPTLASSTPVSDGLVGYWTFDGSKTNWATGKTLDSAGNNTGQLFAMSTTTSPVIGKVGQGFRFFDDGRVDTLVNTLLPATLPNGYTGSAWIKTTDTNSYIYELNGSDGLVMGTSAGGAFCRLRDASFFTTSGNATAVNGQWHNVVCVYNRAVNTLSLYVDGQFSTSADTTGFVTIQNGAGPFHIASRNIFNGIIDDVRIYNRTLSSSEIQQLYNMSK